MSDLPPPAGRNLDFSKLRLRPREQRSHKVRLDLLGKPTPRGCSFADWLDSLPGFLGANEFRATVRAMIAARRAGRPVLLGFGGHVVKTGCSPLIIDMMQRGIITGICTNGSGAIHDMELAETGETSEEVAETIRDGTFGMVIETCERMNAAAARGATAGGLGRALGELLIENKAPHVDLSLFAAAARLNMPATIHVALGTDTVHMHPLADGGAIGQATMHDFRTFCAVVADMTADAPATSGGVFLNIGSAVVLPEVFLKAVSVARNLGHSLAGMHTANFDMLRHYRPAQNVVGRPVAPGCGHSVTGQHEILLPLLRQAIVELL